MIRIEGLTKYYGSRLAIENLNFSIEGGEILGFLGPNGAGKTTTLRIITTFLRPTSGTVKVDSLDVREKPLEVRKKIGYLPENAPSYRDMKVGEFLKFRMRLKGISSRECPEKMKDLLEKCGLGKVEHQLIGELSKGFRQRVGFAEALSADPPILILDEPTAGMDPSQTREIRNLIRGLSSDHTILFSSHILPEVEKLCSRVVIIHEGKMVAQGKPEELKKKISQNSPLLAEIQGSREEIEQAFSGFDMKMELLGEEGTFLLYQFTPGEKYGEDFSVEVYKKISQEGWNLRTLKRETKNLEDVFIHLTG